MLLDGLGGGRSASMHSGFPPDIASPIKSCQGVHVVWSLDPEIQSDQNTGIVDGRLIQSSNWSLSVLPPFGLNTPCRSMGGEMSIASTKSGTRPFPAYGTHTLVERKKHVDNGSGAVTMCQSVPGSGE